VVFGLSAGRLNRAVDRDRLGFAFDSDRYQRLERDPRLGGMDGGFVAKNGRPTTDD
jgi:hypothetical protein